MNLSANQNGMDQQDLRDECSATIIFQAAFFVSSSRNVFHYRSSQLRIFGRSLGPMNKDIKAYNNAQSKTNNEICNVLYEEICENMPEAEKKVWHAHPVWFLEGNPIVGYSKLKDCIRLLFWSGWSFEEKLLQKEGGFMTAGIRYTSADQINKKDLARWLEKSKRIQWDYKNIVKRKGVLERLK